MKKKTENDDSTALNALAAEVASISSAVARLSKGKFNRRAILLLIADACDRDFSTGNRGYSRKPTVSEVETILSGIEALKTRLFNKKDQPTADVK